MSAEINNWEDIIVYVARLGYVGVSWHECSKMRLISPSVGRRISGSLMFLDARACKIVNDGQIPPEVALLSAMPSFPKLEWLELDYAASKEASTPSITNNNALFSVRDQHNITELIKTGWGRLRCLSLRGSIETVSASLLHEIGKHCTSLEVLDVSY